MFCPDVYFYLKVDCALRRRKPRLYLLDLVMAKAHLLGFLDRAVVSYSILGIRLTCKEPSWPKFEVTESAPRSRRITTVFTDGCYIQRSAMRTPFRLTHRVMRASYEVRVTCYPLPLVRSLGPGQSAGFLLETGVWKQKSTAAST